MKGQMAARLAELKKEYQSGEAQLRELIQQEAVLRETLLRISGAIQVLEELIGQDGQDSGGTWPGDQERSAQDRAQPGDVLTVS